ncbi:MAG: CYTH and CHAD domain-containing protein [Alphaproteobacteria bacterium]|nr:CYTH and CHAD domain-containing protein [Alphaproteobacteria bacterium]
MKPDELGRLRRHPLLRELRLAAARTRKLHNVYFDTDDLALRKNRIALRVRHVGSHRIQTLKAPDQDGSVGAAHRYREWEAPILGDRPDLDRIEDGEMRESLPVAGAEELKEAFVSDITRSTTALVLEDSKIELAVDTGEIATPNGSERVCEAELELKSGRPARLYELALRLHDRVPFTVEYRSKASRGYDLLLGAKPQPTKAAPLDLDAGLTAWQGFAVIARQCLQHLRANEDCSRLGEDPEGVHQLRVGIRRLRAAFSLFAGVLPAEQREHFVSELRWAQQSFAPARDWDVFIGETLRPLLERLPDDDSVLGLIELAERARGEAYELVAATLDERRYTRLQLQLDLWLESGGVQSDAAVDGTTPGPWNRPIGDVAREVLAVRHRKVRKLAKQFDELQDDRRHQLRINAKKARYAAEFFRGLFPRKTAQQYARRLAEMQDCLGSMNDAVVGRRLVDDLAAAGAALGRANDLLAGWHAARIAGDMPRAARISKKIVKLDRFWDDL